MNTWYNNLIKSNCNLNVNCYETSSHMSIISTQWTWTLFFWYPELCKLLINKIVSSHVDNFGCPPCVLIHNRFTNKPLSSDSIEFVLMLHSSHPFSRCHQHRPLKLQGCFLMIIHETWNSRGGYYCSKCQEPNLEDIQIKWNNKLRSHLSTQILGL